VNYSQRFYTALIKDSLTIILIALPIWCLLRVIWHLWQRRRPTWFREAVLCLFAAYMTGLLYTALDGAWTSPAAMLSSAIERVRTLDRIRLTPFLTISRQLQKLPQLESIVQLMGNIFLFSPWGFCLPLLWRRFRTPLRIIGTSLALTCFIELTQLFISRYVEIDDIILNFLGSMAGAGLWLLLHRFWPQTDTLFLPVGQR